jgi:asparagine synthase (glutamine-hydrolysing)
MIAGIVEFEGCLDGREKPLSWAFPRAAEQYRTDHCRFAGGPLSSVGRCTGTGVSSGPAIVAAFDGRIDNRSDLLSACAMRDEDCRSDSALVAALYRKYGESAAARIVGEFCLFLYDEADRSVYGAVDFASSRRLWWRQVNTSLVMASNIGSLYADSESIRVEEDYFVELLLTGWNGGRGGPLKGSFKLLPGEFLRASRGSAVVRKYWCPTHFEPGGGRNTDDCVEQLESLLRESVAARIPANENVLCDLSGGLDSTTISSIAGQVLGAERFSRLHGFTVTYPDDPGADERLEASQVARQVGLNHHLVGWPSSELLFRGMPENAYYWDEPRFNVHSHAMALAKQRVLQSIGARRVLNGMGAEVVLCEHMMWPVFFADRFIRGQWGQLLKGLKAWQGRSRIPMSVLFYRSCMAPLINPVAAMRAEVEQRMPPWVTPAAIRRFRHIQSTLPRPVIRRRNTSGTWMAEQWQASASTAEQGYGAYMYESSSPFLHKPLVEAVLGMPWEAKSQPNRNKMLLRRLAVKLLPPGFDKRKMAPADSAVGKALAVQHDHVRRCMTPSTLAEIGIVDESRLLRSIEMLQAGLGRGMRFLVTVGAAELWTRSVVSGDWQRMQVRNLRSIFDPQVSVAHTASNLLGVSQ